jgi:hypothetical protein
MIMSPTKDIVKNASESSGFAVSSIPPSSIFHPPSSQRIDSIQAAVERMPQVELPLTHRFTPGNGSATGIYIRTIFMPKGALVVSKIHRTQHPFVVTKGCCLIWDSMAGGAAIIKAGHIGITMPGTRRILYIYENTEWTTFHATDKTTPEAVEADIIEPRDFDREEALKLFVAASRECALTGSDVVLSFRKKSQSGFTSAATRKDCGTINHTTCLK